MMWQARRVLTPSFIKDRAPDVRSAPTCVRERPAVFSQQTPHRIDLQLALGQQSLQLAVFPFEFLEPTHILTLQATMLTLPGVEGVLAETMLAAELGLALVPTGCFLQNTHNLFFTELALFQDLTPLNLSSTDLSLIFYLSRFTGSRPLSQRVESKRT